MGKRLRAWRKANRYTAAAMARRCGVDPRTWHRWEDGDSFPRLAQWGAIECATDRSVTIRELSEAYCKWRPKKAQEKTA